MNNIVQKLSTTNIMNELIEKRIEEFRANPSFTTLSQVMKYGINLYIYDGFKFIELQEVNFKDLDCSTATPLYRKDNEIYGVWVTHKRMSANEVLNDLKQ